jgi:hypothetical protein
MQFFLYEIAARVVAIYLCVDCIRTVRSGLVERKITSFSYHAGILDWLLDWSTRSVFHRETAPVAYWIQIGIQITLLVSCFFVAIFGWWHPNA